MNVLLVTSCCANVQNVNLPSGKYVIKLANNSLYKTQNDGDYTALEAKYSKPNGRGNVLLNSAAISHHGGTAISSAIIPGNGRQPYGSAFVTNDNIRYNSDKTNSRFDLFGKPQSQGGTFLSNPHYPSSKPEIPYEISGENKAVDSQAFSSMESKLSDMEGHLGDLGDSDGKNLIGSGRNPIPETRPNTYTPKGAEFVNGLNDQPIKPRRTSAYSRGKLDQKMVGTIFWVPVVFYSKPQVSKNKGGGVSNRFYYFPSDTSSTLHLATSVNGRAIPVESKENYNQ